MVGNCSLMGSKSLTAMSRPLLASCASSDACFMVPNGPPVLDFWSKVPAECHLYHQIIHRTNQYNKSESQWLRNTEIEILRDTKHERSTVLLSNEAPELSLRLLNRLLVIRAHGWVFLRHFQVSTAKQRNQKQTKTRSAFDSSIRNADEWNTHKQIEFKDQNSRNKPWEQKSRWEKWENSNPNARER